MTLSAKYKGSITLVVASHIPPAGNPGGTSDWNRTGGEVTVNFDNQNSATFSVPVTQVSGANSYRIEVKGTTPAAGWSVNENSLNTKSKSFECGATKTPTPTVTATVVATNTPTATLTATVVATNTPTSTPTATAVATETPTATPTVTGTVVETTPTATATAISTPSSESGNIAVFKSMCNDIGAQDTCVRGHDTSLEGYKVDFNVRAGADASGPVIQTIIVTLGDNAGGGGNVANGGMGRSVGSALPVGTYTVCEVPVAYKAGFPDVPLQAFPRPTASQGGSTGGSNQWQTGELCITVELTPGTAELKFLDVRTQPTATPAATATPSSEATPTATAVATETPTATPPTEATPTVTATPPTETTPTVTATPPSEATPTATPTATGGGGEETPPTSTPTATTTLVTPTATPGSNGGDNGNGGNGGDERQPAPSATPIPPAAAGPGPSGEVAGAAPQPAAAQPPAPAAPAAPTPEVAGFMPAPPPAMPAPAAPAPEVLAAPPATAPPAQVPAQLGAARAPQAPQAAPSVLPTTGEADSGTGWEIAALMGMMLSIGGIATIRRRGAQSR